MIKHRKIFVSDLRTGMFVSKLDRPWLESPFLVQGFYIDDESDLAKLAESCSYVFVDEKISRQTKGTSFTTNRSNAKAIADIFPDRKLKNYVDSVDWKEEFPKAREAVATLSSCLSTIFSPSAKGGSLEILKIKQAVEPMIDSVTRNPDACIWLARMKREDNYMYEHSLGASIWSVALGRQLGLPKRDLRSLAIGGLLFDIGKLELDKDLLSSNRALTKEEFGIVKTHVDFSVESLKRSGMINQDIIDMVSHHHEKHDGSGYPQGLREGNIPVFARIAAIVDCYDAITSHRVYAKAIPPTMAIKKLYELKGFHFQQELVEEFIQAIGIYPAGTLVELTSGEVAVVVAEYRSRRLRPQVMLMLDKNKQVLQDIKIIDLLNVTHAEDGTPLDILDSLKPDAYGIDLTAIDL